MKPVSISGLEIRGEMSPAAAAVLTPEACDFLAGIFRKFGARRDELLARRVERQREIDAGDAAGFPR